MVKDRPLRDLLDAVADRRPLTVSRWGHDEWCVLNGQPNRLSVPPTGFTYLVELQQKLWRLLEGRPPYHLSLACDDPWIVPTIEAAGFDRLDWGRTRLDARALVGPVREVPLVLVGPPRFSRLHGPLRPAANVTIPPRNAYLARDQIVREVLGVLEDFREPALVSVSAGVAAPLIVDDLFRVVGGRHQLIDFGSLWDTLLENDHGRKRRAG